MKVHLKIKFYGKFYCKHLGQSNSTEGRLLALQIAHLSLILAAYMVL